MTVNNRGVTLTELSIVIAIVGILAVALGFSYQGWMGRYRVEKHTKELFTEIMQARQMAMTRNTFYFVDFPTVRSYRVIEDTNGNSASNPGAGDTVVTPGGSMPTDYALSANGAGIPGTTFILDKRGLVSPERTICIFTENDPDYDCIVLSTTRISMGKIINQGNACGASNCERK